MLDISEILKTTKDSRIEFCVIFEQNHLELIEYLSNKINETAKKGFDRINIHIDTDKNSIFEVCKYLEFKGFKVRIEPGNITKTYFNNNDHSAGNWNKPAYDELEVVWF